MSSDREQFKTRLGFLLIAAGCAIGLGNVWRFPYITGMYGGALFVIIYLAFLLGVGMPLLTIELAIGRASRRSIARAYEVLEQPKTKWHWNKFWQIPGSYILMSFYSVITGWLFYGTGPDSTSSTPRFLLLCLFFFTFIAYTQFSLF